MKKNNNHHYLSYGHFSFVRDLTFRRNLYVVKELPHCGDRARHLEKNPLTSHAPNGMPDTGCQDWRCARVCVTLRA
jgi:hypothetical protein